MQWRLVSSWTWTTALVLGLSAPALARDVIGEEEPEEKKEEPAKPAPKDAKAAPPAKDGKAVPPAKDAKAAPPAKDGKAVPPAKDGKAEPAAKDDKAAPPGKKGKTEAELEKEAEEADAAAMKKAEEESRKKREEEAKKKKDAEDKRAASKAEIGKGNLEDARKSRVYKRLKDGLLFTAKVLPGAVEDNKMSEMEFTIVQKLEDPDPTYGDWAPVEDGDFMATFTCQSLPAPKDPKAKPGALPPPVVYEIHPLGDAGKYGLHATLPNAGVWQLKVTGKKKDSQKATEVNIPLHVSVWPPPDFDTEEKNNVTLTGSGRRALE